VCVCVCVLAFLGKYVHKDSTSRVAFAANTVSLQSTGMPAELNCMYMSTVALSPSRRNNEL
jgi:hypothetical protein